MFASNLITDLNHCSDNIQNLDSYEIKNLKTTHAGPALVPQPDPWPHQTSTGRTESTTSQAFTPSEQWASNIDASEWQGIGGHSTTMSSAGSILQQALPGVLSAPKGWHSERIRSSSSAFTDIGDTQPSNRINVGTNVFAQHPESKTLKTTNGSPMIFSSIDQTERLITDIPSIPAGFTSNTFGESKNVSVDSNLHQQQAAVLTDEQRAAIATIDTQQPPPLVIRKQLAGDPVQYQQNISVRYLQPPTPPPPGPIIIREVRPPPPCPKSPIQIRQRPPPSRTPPPIIIRERPPPIPPRPPSQVIERLLPPPPRPPRRLIVEQYGPCPPKPPDVIVERWLPYRRSDRRRIFFERAPAPYRPRSPNVVVMHGQPNARIHKEFINQGVTRVDPQYYVQHYGNEIDSGNLHSQYAQLINEATRNYPPPPPRQQPPPTLDYHTPYPPYPNTNHHSPSPLVSSVWERMKSASPVAPPPYHHPYPPTGYHGQYPHENQWPSHPNYPSHFADQRTMPNTTSSYHGHNYSPSPYPYSPSYPSAPTAPHSQTIQVQSDQELHHVLSDLTNGRVPTPLRSF